jgi:hypothetical protein
MAEAKTTSRNGVPPLELINNSSDSSDWETVDSRNENANDRDASPESGIDINSRGTTGITENETTMVSESTDRTVIPPNQMFNFDLTNPDEVVKLLESVNLTDEDTDVLLQEAYNVNMKLKEILRRQEKSGGKLKASDVATIKGSNVVVSGPSKDSKSRPDSASKRSQFTKATPLPPISNGSTPNSNMRIPSAVYSAKLSRPVPPPSGQKRTSFSSQDKRMGSRNPSATTMVNII